MKTPLKIWILVLSGFVLALSARAAPLDTSDDEQKTILTICRMAAKSPIISDEDTAGVAQFCVMWKAKMQAAEAAKTEQKPEAK